MVKKLNYYEGNVILGYRIVIPKVSMTGFVKSNKKPTQVSNGYKKSIRLVRTGTRHK